MLFFDYLFYAIAKFYQRHKEKGAISTAAGIVGGFQAANLLTLYFLYTLTETKKQSINYFLIISLFLLFQVTTYIRYVYREKPSFDVMGKKWADRPEPARKKLRISLYVYGIVSIIALFAIAIYGGEKNRQLLPKSNETTSLIFTSHSWPEQGRC